MKTAEEAAKEQDALIQLAADLTQYTEGDLKGIIATAYRRGLESRQKEADALKADNTQLAQALLRLQEYMIEKDKEVSGLRERLDESKSAALEFAKAIVRAALYAASENAELKDTDEKIHCLLGEDAYRQEVDKDSIIHAFTDKEVEDSWNNPA